MCWSKFSNLNRLLQFNDFIYHSLSAKNVDIALRCLLSKNERFIIGLDHNAEHNDRIRDVKLQRRIYP